MAWVVGRIPAARLAWNLAIVSVSNLVGAVGLAALVAWSGHWRMAEGAVGTAAVATAGAKCALPFGEAFVRGILCNVLVCLAVWLAMVGRTVTDEAVAISFPITAFVACGFEHSVANMYFIPLGLLLRAEVPLDSPLAALSWLGFLRNLVPVTLGNLVGGAGMVGLVYWVIYRRGAAAEDRGRRSHL
jgi:formate/nitrite transporter